MVLIALVIGLILALITENIGFIIVGLVVAVGLIYLEMKWLHQHIHDEIHNHMGVEEIDDEGRDI